ncbi:ATP-binding cassette domain-containing protein [Candidatus Amarobacter glycogenicus]|uniref:ATP-binding cassette domain-containing protein n=1 Tax=Candidatus Amarobacter glycogenicus TaxID=3140699 RepID=UPI002A0AEE2B|nr:ATP-binding cassette domain-containing protein [Dehalococcoidia bacterium]
MSTALISSVRKSFGRVEAVKDVSFEVFPGEIFGLLGPNGAGKTTTIRMMLDIFEPDAGQISVFDGRVTEASKQRIGYMPEERGLYKDLQQENPRFLAPSRSGGKRSQKAPGRLAKRLDLFDHRQRKSRN